MVSLALDSPELAEKYDVVGQRQYQHGLLLIEDLGIHAGQRVLDVGCGTGLLGAFVAGIVGPRGKVHGIDPLPLRVEIARKKGPSQFEPNVGNAEDLSAFASQSFDVVYLNSVIHWLPDKRAVLGEIRRVLRPGGLVGFTTAAKERPHSFEQVRHQALVAAGLADHPSANLGSPYRTSSEEVRQLFRETGLEERQVVIRTFTDHFAGVDDVLSFSRASSFGNHLSGLSPVEAARVRDALATELELHRDEQGIRQERHLIFAVARKPSADA
jgi:arsenite methyltransferase